MSLVKSSHDLRLAPESPRPGGMAWAGSARAPAGSRYCYLFPDLAADPAAGCFAGGDESETVRRLGAFEEAARLPAMPPPALTLPLPAAYTYFGQFLNHDISAPLGGPLAPSPAGATAGVIGTSDPFGNPGTRRLDPAGILALMGNQHEAPLTLSSLYADGPRSPDPEVAALYDPDGKRFRLARTAPPDMDRIRRIGLDPALIHRDRDAPDIPRAGRIPLIADRRNDGNLILSQLHLALMRAHNRAVAVLEPDHPQAADCFAAARRLLTLHYQWLVLHDFLPRLLSPRILGGPLADRPRRPLPPGAVPLEFTTAAFRFGHSMVGRRYDYNANFGQGGHIDPRGASLMDLFAFTSQGGMGGSAATPGQLPDHWVIDWPRLTHPPTAGAATPHGGAERIDLDFAPDMLNVAGEAALPEHGSILYRNLMRGFHRRIPFGQRLAEACGIPPLSPDRIRAALPRHLSPNGTDPTPAAAAERLGLVAQTPAWLYFLCEADAIEDGQRVGPTASAIIADTITALLRTDGSLLSGAEREWHPAQSPLRTATGQPLDSIGTLLLWATDRAAA